MAAACHHHAGAQWGGQPLAAPATAPWLQLYLSSKPEGLSHKNDTLKMCRLTTVVWSRSFLVGVPTSLCLFERNAAIAHSDYSLQPSK